MTKGWKNWTSSRKTVQGKETRASGLEVVSLTVMVIGIGIAIAGGQPELAIMASSALGIASGSENVAAGREGKKQGALSSKQTRSLEISGGINIALNSVFFVGTAASMASKARSVAYGTEDVVNNGFKNLDEWLGATGKVGLGVVGGSVGLGTSLRGVVSSAMSGGFSRGATVTQALNDITSILGIGMSLAAVGGAATTYYSYRIRSAVPPVIEVADPGVVQYTAPDAALPERLSSHDAPPSLPADADVNPVTFQDYSYKIDKEAPGGNNFYNQAADFSKANGRSDDPFVISVQQGWSFEFDKEATMRDQMTTVKFTNDATGTTVMRQYMNKVPPDSVIINWTDYVYDDFSTDMVKAYDFRTLTAGTNWWNG